MPTEGEQDDNPNEGSEEIPLGGAPEAEIEAPEEEAHPQRNVPRPDLPSHAEIDRHRVDHIPYRAWCPECVEGVGRERDRTTRGM